MAIIQFARRLVERIFHSMFCRPCNIWLWKLNFHNVDRHAEFCDKSWKFRGRIWSISEYETSLWTVSQSRTGHVVLWELLHFDRSNADAMRSFWVKIEWFTFHSTHIHVSHFKGAIDIKPFDRNMSINFISYSSDQTEKYTRVILERTESNRLVVFIFDNKKSGKKPHKDLK